FPLHQSHTIALIRKDKPNRTTERLHRLSTRGHPLHRQSRRGHGVSHPPTRLASPHGLHSGASRAPSIRPHTRSWWSWSYPVSVDTSVLDGDRRGVVCLDHHLFVVVGAEVAEGGAGGGR